MKEKIVQFLFIVALILPGSNVFAADQSLEMSLGKVEVIDLQSDAGALILADPTCVTAQLDSPSRLVLIPHCEAVTSLTVLDQKGKELLARDVVVSARKTGRVVINRHCPSDIPAGNCPPSTVHHCTDNCVEINQLSSSGTAETSGTIYSEETSPSSLLDELP